MELAFYADPLEKFVIKKDSTFALMKEAGERGHRIYAFCQHDLVLNGQNVHARVNGIELTGTEDHRWFDVRETEDRGLETFDAVIVRKDRIS